MFKLKRGSLGSLAQCHFDASDYLKKIRTRDQSLGEAFKGGQIVPPFGRIFILLPVAPCSSPDNFLCALCVRILPPFPQQNFKEQIGA